MMCIQRGYPGQSTLCTVSNAMWLADPRQDEINWLLSGLEDTLSIEG
jgi:hypothetical protein